MQYRILGTLLGVLFAVFVMIFLLKVDTSKEHSTQISGLVLSVSNGPSYDIIIQLRGQPTSFYINRGLESGLDVDTLTEQLLGDSVTFWVGDQLIGTPRHITHLEHDDILYTEWGQ